MCGGILIVAGIFLFIGMGINYHLVAKEQEAERQQKKESKEEETNVDVEKPKEVANTAESPEQKDTEDSPKEEESPVWACSQWSSSWPKVSENILLVCHLPVVLNANSGHLCGNPIRCSLMEFLFHSLPVAQIKNAISFGEGVVGKEWEKEVGNFCLLFWILAFNSVMKIIICALSFSL